MSEFSTYEKMPNNFKKLGLTESDFSSMDKLKWVVTEKVHGANFSFVYENGNLKFAKRKEFIDWKDDFFGFQLVVSEQEDKLLRLFETLSSQVEGTRYIVYGELFGGKYPHPDVMPPDDVQAIQTGVYYSPTINFCAFDIGIETDGVSSKYYLDYDRATNLFSEFGILYAKPLFIGKLSDALNFNLRINSSIPKELGLPELKENLIEGVVVKPYNQTDFDTLGSRPIIKLKNPEFDEEEKFHEAEKWNFIPSVTSKTAELSFIMDDLRNYITVNRLKSAVSKIGAMDKNNVDRMAEIRSEFLSDVITDFNENNNNFLESLTPVEKLWIIERINGGITKVMASPD